MSPQPGSWATDPSNTALSPRCPSVGAQALGNCPREVGNWPFITQASRAQQGLAQACTPCVPLLPPLCLLSVSPRHTVLSLGLVPSVCMSVLRLSTPLLLPFCQLSPHRAPPCTPPLWQPSWVPGEGFLSWESLIGHAGVERRRSQPSYFTPSEKKKASRDFGRCCLLESRKGQTFGRVGGLSTPINP